MAKSFANPMDESLDSSFILQSFSDPLIFSINHERMATNGAFFR